MRERKKNQKISVHAIAGTHVVLLGLDATDEAAQGLLGFTITRKQKGEEDVILRGGRGFEGVHDKEALKKAKVHSDTAPIQAFMWGDYAVTPGTKYTYQVVPMYGAPGGLKPGEDVEVTITTEDPEEKTHGIYFNRGVAGSQAYSRLFGEHRKWYKVETSRGRVEWREFIKPEDVPNREAHTWLSRGLEEAMLAFIGQAQGPEYSIRAAVYEFTYLPAIQAFVDALERGVDVKIVHHAKQKSTYRLKRNDDAKITVEYAEGKGDPQKFENKEVLKEQNKDSVCQAADAAVRQIGLTNPDYLDAFDQMMIERTITEISHNKFIVLLENGKPVQVWTGSTNYTAGGIFGQSNVGHVVRNAEVARKYYKYWQKLSTDPKKKSAKSDPEDEGIQNWTVLHSPDLKGPPPPNSITPVFSPRLKRKLNKNWHWPMLDWYADQLDAAKHSVHFTAAFGVSQEIGKKLVRVRADEPKTPFLRYIMLEGIPTESASKKRKDKKKEKREPIPVDYYDFVQLPENRIAWGDTLKKRAGGEDKHKQFIETLTGLNDHVNYLHTKYMLIDPLSDDPTVITGSANFSEASTSDNDENMLIIRGNTRVADIFLGEFMRLFNHFYIRNWRNQMTDEQFEESSYLTPDSSWTMQYYKEGTKEYAERLLFR